MRLTFTLLLCVSSFFTSTAQSTLIFHDDFETGGFQSEWALHPARDNGAIEVFPCESMEGQYAARLGKSADGNLAINRLDLRLDLSNVDDAELRVMMAHNHDDPHVQDGIYLSDDGEHFVKVFGFVSDVWQANTPGMLPPLNLRTLATAHRMTLTSSFVVRFQQYDDHDFTGGADFSDGLFIDDVKVQTPPNDYATLPFLDDFEEPELSSYWSRGDPTQTPETVVNPSGRVELFVTEDTAQRQAVRLGNSVDKSWATNTLDLRVNLLDQPDATLSFKLCNNHDETHPQDGLFFSDDGGLTFIKVYDFDLDHWQGEGFGQFPPLPIQRLAQENEMELTDRFVIRFQQHDDDDFDGSRLTSDGFFIDDVQIEARPAVYATLPFFEDFERFDQSPYWHRRIPYYDDVAIEIKPSGVVAPVFYDSTLGHVMKMGSATDKSYNTNALDLHVDLSQTSNPELSFWIYDNYDETHPQDGLYFSEDGGETFKKVYQFDGDQWGDRVFGQLHALNIRDLAKAQQIALSNTFVIRFQQHDDDDFDGTRTISDGIYLDNVQVGDPAITYRSALPLVEGFESDSLSVGWHHRYPEATAPPETIRPDGVATVIDSMSHTGNRALLLGKLDDGYPTVSSLDLHLNLARQRELELSFWLRSNYDEEDPEDGIWFSSDGGKSFKKAYSFDHQHRGKYAPFRLNMDSLLQKTQQHYSDHFVVRFQQLGERRVDGDGIFRHGVILDDIVISSPALAPEVSQATKEEEEGTNE